MLSDIRVFVIDDGQIDLYENCVSDLSDDEFMALAEDGGAIYTLSEFENVFNSGDCHNVNPDSHFIRFIRP